ncbi:MAG: hypothetical protein RSD69_03520 [Bacilli bacterium]
MKKTYLMHFLSLGLLFLTAVFAFILPAVGGTTLMGNLFFSLEGVTQVFTTIISPAGWATDSPAFIYNIVLVLIIVVYLFFAITLLTLSLVRKRKVALWGISFLTITFALFVFAFCSYACNAAAISETISAYFAAVGDGNITSTDTLSLVEFVCFVLSAVAFVVLEFVLFFITLAAATGKYSLTKKEALSEQEIRLIVKEELLAFFDENSIELADEVPEEQIKEEKIEQPISDNLLKEEDVPNMLIEEEEIPTVVEEPIIEPTPVEEEVIPEPVQEVKEEVVPVEEVAVVAAPITKKVKKSKKADIEEDEDEETPEGEETNDIDNDTLDLKGQIASMHLTAQDLDGNGRISFVERFLAAEEDIFAIYNTIKNELFSYGIKSRVSSSGDSFRLHRVNYCKMTIAGKRIKLYLNLNPNDYLETSIPFGDASNKKIYADIPFVFKVKSPLSIKRAKDLIADMMYKHGVQRIDLPQNVDYATQILDELTEILNAEVEAEKNI